MAESTGNWAPRALSMALRHLYVEEQAMWSRSGVQQMHWSFTGETTRTPCSGTTEWDSDDSDSTNSQAFQACRSMVEVQEAATPGPRPKQDHGLPRGFQLCEQRANAMPWMSSDVSLPHAGIVCPIARVSILRCPHRTCDGADSCWATADMVAGGKPL
ncbi:hypothetical protein AK812_SmicGene9901 [Symbiodinium microadriaticum]|uniref:Uncharacterized protein n=1 Tax=Symbiodinium microadriaticum TaxID=2951 RepID=A0A1Q9EHA5_SYMMI|nr:hypothetical protein AK812_SmicGene9901 [Symbiodinium microadriaticum]